MLDWSELNEEFSSGINFLLFFSDQSLNIPNSCREFFITVRFLAPISLKREYLGLGAKRMWDFLICSSWIWGLTFLFKQLWPKTPPFSYICSGAKSTVLTFRPVWKPNEESDHVKLYIFWIPWYSAFQWCAATLYYFKIWRHQS